MKKLVKFLVAAVFAVAIFAVSSVETADAYTVTARNNKNLALKTSVQTYGGYVWDTAEKQAMFPEVPKYLMEVRTRGSRGYNVTDYKDFSIYLNKKADSGISTMVAMLDKSITTWNEAKTYADHLYVYGSDGKQILCKLEQEPGTGRFGLRSFGSGVSGIKGHGQYEVVDYCYDSSTYCGIVCLDGYWPHVTFGSDFTGLEKTCVINGTTKATYQNAVVHYKGIQEDEWGDYVTKYHHLVHFFEEEIRKAYPNVKEINMYFTMTFGGKTDKIYTGTYKVDGVKY